MTSTYPCSVALAAHGSLAYPNANRSLFELADQVANSGLFSQVTPAFLNGQPQASEVFGLLPDGDVVVVPVMTSDGYYTKNVLTGQIGCQSKN